MSSTPAQQALVAALNPLFTGGVFALIAPDTPATPFAVYQIVASAPENTLAQGVTLENDRYQVDIYAPLYQDVHDLADSARAALIAIAWPLSFVFLTQTDQFEAELKLHRVTMDFSVWQNRRL